MSQHVPEELVGESRVPLLTRMREVIKAGRRRPAHRGERPAVQTQRVANVIEANGMVDLRIDQADDVAPGTKGPGLSFDARLPRELRHQMVRDEIAKVMRASLCIRLI